VSGIGLLYGINGEGANGIDTKLIESRTSVESGCVHNVSDADSAGPQNGAQALDAQPEARFQNCTANGKAMSRYGVEQAGGATMRAMGVDVIHSARTSRRARFAFGVLLGLIAGATRAQQHEPNVINISGVVYSDEGNKRISGAVVQLCDPSGRMIVEHHTQSLGEFTFRGVSPGVYTIHVNADGYEPTQFDPGSRLVQDQTFSIFVKTVDVDLSKPLSTDAAISAHELSMPRGARELYSSGMKKLYAENNAQGGLADFQKCLRKAPSYYEAQFQAGMAQLRLDQGKEAEVSFQKAIAMSDGKYAEPEVALGVIYFDRGDLGAAKAQFQRGLAANPSQWIACYKLGQIEYRQKNLTEAEVWAEKAKQLAPKMAMIYELRAQIHVGQKNYAAALKDLDAYVQIEQDSGKLAWARDLREKIQQHLETQ
jgi:Tfp pilus assembly protein PilF